jgi:Cof subfamily protein (haloacid dehalogenase superfamily)
MARFRLVAMDLDGTLFDSRRSVPERNRIALERAHEQGVRLALVTGRRLPAARPHLSQLNPDLLMSMVMVLNGGALVRRGLDGPDLRRELIPISVTREVIALAAEIGAVPVVHEGPDGEGGLLMEESAPLNRPLQRYLDKATPSPRRVPDLASALTRDPLHILFAGPILEMRATALAIEQRLGSRLNVARTEYEASDLGIVDVLAPAASKGDALRFIAERERIPRDQTMAIGDNWNDLGMLEAAGLGVVMANAARELRERFAVTRSNDECGVAEAIERYVLSES